MPELQANFNIQDFENYGSTSSYLSEEQQSRVSLVEDRVNSQLDWIAQILGWNGRYYWDNLVSNVSQKRHILNGTFGVYNGFIYPEVIEIRNWENSVWVKPDSRILQATEFFLGDYSYKPTGISQKGDRFEISFSELSEQFLADISADKQLKAIAASSLPYPFHRPRPGISADASFICQQQGNSLVLHPSYDTSLSFPYLYNVFIKGARYFFDKPISLRVYYREDPNQYSEILPEYDFNLENWYINVPSDLDYPGGGFSATLVYEESPSEIFSLEISLVSWENPSDWLNKNTIENFKGVWNNKGGKLPFHFVFDATNIHGFDERKSVYLGNVQRSVPFDQLLEFVYYQKANVSPSYPSGRQTSQIWWNSQNGTFSAYIGDYLNCGPWVEVGFPELPPGGYPVDYVFPDVASFESYLPNIPEGCVVRILNIIGLNPSNNILGVTDTFQGPGEIDIFKNSEKPYWYPLEFSFANEQDFSDSALYIPEKVRVNILNALDLSPQGPTYTINNLKITISQGLPISLMKESPYGKWFVAPPSHLKYVGNTRLFASSKDNYSNPVDGELSWDFSEPDVNSRSLRIFYYNRWTIDPLTGKPVLEGDWVSVNDFNPNAPVPETVNFGAIKVYCNGNLVQENISYRTTEYQFSYSVDSQTGSFNFLYVPIDYEAICKFPRITISDSLTTAFVHDISNLVFSGLTYYMSPNVLDSQTPLRLWKSENLRVVDSLSDLELLRNQNPLRADINSGPGDPHWERYFVRLPPSYGRNESIWQKVNLICQNFGYWGSSIYPEEMECPADQTSPRIYESVHLYNERLDSPVYLYSEPYLFSDVVFGYSVSDDYENSCVLPSYDQPYDDFLEAEIIPYEPLHYRQADVISDVGTGYGEWEGAYYRASECSNSSGFLVNDLLSGQLEPISPPVWDSSIYKLPPSCVKSKSSSTVDSNHYKVGYAFFAADLSVAEDGVFDLNCP